MPFKILFILKIPSFDYIKYFFLLNYLQLAKNYQY